MKNLIKKYSGTTVVLMLALGFFLFTSLYILINQPDGYPRWSSPDETANYFFSSLYSTQGELSYYDEAAALSQGWSLPRSLRSDSGYVKPVSFLGLPLIFGSLAFFFGQAIIPFLTPFFAALGIVIFYFLIRRLFSERIALWSSFLLAFFPVYIYYSIRSMFHNVLFIVLLLAALYLLSSLLLKKECKHFEGFLSAFFGGVFVGLTVITRTSEVLWLFPILFFVWIFYAKRIGLMRLLLIVAGLFVALLPAAFYNQLFYGSFFYGGYNEMNRSIDEIVATGSVANVSLFGALEYLRIVYEKLKSMIFYFGFKPDQSWLMFKAYALQMFPYLLWTGITGGSLLLLLSTIRLKKKYLVYIFAGLFVAAFLIFYYGSWKFSDNPNSESVTIGNSYTRYWLPIYLWFIPLASFILVRIGDSILSVFKKVPRVWRIILFGIQALVIVFYAAWSLNFVLFGSEEGLAYWRYNNAAERQAAAHVLNNTEDGAIIITRYHDKYLFPFRRVIVGSLPDNDIAKVVSFMADKYPVYYYNFFLDEAAVNYLNSSKFPPYNLKMTLLLETGPKFALYSLEKITASSTEGVLVNQNK